MGYLKKKSINANTEKCVNFGIAIVIVSVSNLHNDDECVFWAKKKICFKSDVENHPSNSSIVNRKYESVTR